MIVGCAVFVTHPLPPLKRGAIAALCILTLHAASLHRVPTFGSIHYVSRCDVVGFFDRREDKGRASRLM